MALNKAYSLYKENSVFTSTPEELTFMLYNGLVKFIMKAQSGIEENDIEKAANSIIRAEEIILYFRNTLDMKYEVSAGLDLLYEYMYRRLFEANISKDGEIIAEVLSLAKDLRDTWDKAMKLAKNKQRPHLAVQE